ncbi:hypothetical protein [Kribbella deserti]|uniref:Uncharacterized protein n=1 Tax=Kribbella deserti TaxID=1926257 RepID=A0ABV6QSM5_9ACTN
MAHRLGVQAASSEGVGSKMGLLRRIVAVAVVAVALVGAAQPAASARVQWADENFERCLDIRCKQKLVVKIVWGQRTAVVSGKMINADWQRAPVHVRFWSLANGIMVHHTTRTSHIQELPFSFVLGDPNRVGGIDEIWTQFCELGPTGQPLCQPHKKDIRD